MGSSFALHKKVKQRVAAKVKAGKTVSDEDKHLWTLEELAAKGKHMGTALRLCEGSCTHYSRKLFFNDSSALLACSAFSLQRQ